MVRFTATRTALGLALLLLPAAPAQATFPGRNGRIAYAISGISGHANLATVDPATLSTDVTGAFVTFPRWAPDGQRLAGVEETTLAEPIDVVTADGAPLATITGPGRGYASPARWNPRGDLVAFAWGEVEPVSDEGIYVAPADGSGPPTLLTGGPAGVAPGRFTWARDSRRLAFAWPRPLGDRSDVYVARVDRSGPPRLLAHNATDPDWSLATGRIAFGRAGNVWTMNGDGTHPRLVVRDATQPQWSPSDRRLLFRRGAELWAVGADGRGAIRLADGVADAGEPVWSPDAGQVAFVRAVDGDFEIFTVDAHGCCERRLTFPGGPRVDASEPDWQPLPAQPARH
jgi:Tol biopolymer transport system component